MYLSDLRAALRRYWGLAVLAMAFWVLVGVAMVVVPEAQYRTTATVAIGPDNTGNDTNYASLAALQIPTMVAEIQSRDFVAATRASLPASVADAAVGVSAASDTGTLLIRITTSGPDQVAIVAWANALAARSLNMPQPDGLVPRTIETAGDPGSPYSPKVIPIAVGTTALGILSAILIAVIVARVGKALDLEEEIQRRFGLPVLGRIPATRALRRSADGYSDAMTLNPELMEAFKTLRTNMELLLLDVPQPAVVAVVSWGEGEGKSTVAAGVALTTAVSGIDVLAVDADLRHPALHARLGQPFGEGMAKATDRDIDRLVEPTEHLHLWFLSAGIPDRHPADLLSVVLGRVFEYAEVRDRRLVIDCPPMHGVAETVMVLARAQNVIVVVDGHKTKLPELEAMIGRLHAAGVRVMGIVLNKVQRSKQTSAYPSFVLREDPVASASRTGRDGQLLRPAKTSRSVRRT